MMMMMCVCVCTVGSGKGERDRVNESELAMCERLQLAQGGHPLAPVQPA